MYKEESLFECQVLWCVMSYELVCDGVCTRVRPCVGMARIGETKFCWANEEKAYANLMKAEKDPRVKMRHKKKNEGWGWCWCVVIFQNTPKLCMNGKNLMKMILMDGFSGIAD